MENGFLYLKRFFIYVLPFTHKMDASLKLKSDYVLFRCNHLDYFAIAANELTNWKYDKSLKTGIKKHYIVREIKIF